MYSKIFVRHTWVCTHIANVKHLQLGQVIVVLLAESANHFSEYKDRGAMKDMH